ncbi:MotE family protein [Acidiphilium sp.]|uniref:MotE family protein n=1 Tax=Acidiphilium sp. TaxID=527 RepID=UPI003D01EE86
MANWTDRPPPPPMCKPDPLSESGETAILLALKTREAALDRRAEALDREQQELDATKAALSRQIAALKPLAKRLEALKTQNQSTEDAKWAALVATYGTMDPRNAARIFDGLDPEIVFNVLRRMNSRKSAAILASMSPDKAQSITERLAGEPAPPSMHPANALLPDGAP